MIERITVIGGGSTGHAVAGIMSMRGFKVTLHDDERFADRLQAVKDLGFIQLRGRIRGSGSPVKVTTDAAEAVPGAQAIFVHVPADRHEEIARRIAPYLEDGQVVMIFPDNFGSLLLRKMPHWYKGLLHNLPSLVPNVGHETHRSWAKMSS